MLNEKPIIYTLNPRKQKEKKVVLIGTRFATVL